MTLKCIGFIECEMHFLLNLQVDHGELSGIWSCVCITVEYFCACLV